MLSVQEKVDALSERTDREGAAERGGLDQLDFDSFFTRNILKQKCKYLYLSFNHYLITFIFNIYSKHWKCPENETQPSLESPDQQNCVQL